MVKKFSLSITKLLNLKKRLNCFIGFSYLPKISTIVLNESLFSINQCILVQIQDKKVQRSISNKYVFYKSINLLTVNFTFNDNLQQKCDMVFRFFQFNVHLNLKTDDMFDIFYSSCQSIIIKNEFNFNHTYNYFFINCDSRESYVFLKLEQIDVESLVKLTSNFRKVFSNSYYLLTMSLLLALFVPVFWILFRHGIFSKCNQDLSIEKKKLFKSFEKKISIEPKKKDLIQELILNSRMNLSKSIELPQFNNYVMYKNNNETFKNKTENIGNIEKNCCTDAKNFELLKQNGGIDIN